MARQVALRDLTSEKNAEIVELQKQIMNKDALPPTLPQTRAAM